MKDAAKIAAELAGDASVEAEVLRGIIAHKNSENVELRRLAEKFEEQKIALRDMLKEAQCFIQTIGTEDPEDIESMAVIERLSGRIAAVIEATKPA